MKTARNRKFGRRRLLAASALVLVLASIIARQDI